MVTKRMSLDAFGTPPMNTPSISSASGMEELTEEDESSEDSIERVAEVSGYPHTTLSTIDEGSSANREAPASVGRTLYYTPPSATPNLELRLPSTDSPFIPPPQRQHLSCPPLPVTQALLSAHGDHARALDAELQCARDLIKSLEGEVDEMRQRAEKAERQIGEGEAWRSKVAQLEERLKQREEGERCYFDIVGKADAQTTKNSMVKLRIRPGSTVSVGLTIFDFLHLSLFHHVYLPFLHPFLPIDMCS